MVDFDGFVCFYVSIDGLLGKILTWLKVNHFIFLSSNKVYGENNDYSWIEDSNTNPVSAYGLSKLKAEKNKMVWFSFSSQMLDKNC